MLTLTGGFAAAANYEAQADTEPVSASAVPPAPDLGPAEAANESEARILFTDIKLAEDALPGLVKKY
ncbi:hypothetical protein OHB49_37540 [Streptomyces sp. NBC_01717]|uniref:hypothetical protein n=1 Tax=Streptomyces sp. NBC_01717 TaxID=2975918 RepID=UPI002E324FC0|nr:hypothetical protein [Streptomyces sp. NBC_01717]